MLVTLSVGNTVQTLHSFFLLQQLLMILMLR